ncbi:MAG TPA: head GIN domain-containing protein [Chitinophagaceae bacterium]|nr:head GIN domain-containing protein [Chitinophagaceae bacterium]
MKSILMTFAGLVLMITGLYQPANAQVTRISGDGKIKTESRNISGSFTGIQSSGNFQVFISQGSPASVKVKADENLLSDILTTRDGKNLDLHTRNNVLIHSADPVKIYITLPDLKKLSSSGTGSFESKSQLKVSDLNITVSGRSKLNLNLIGNDIQTVVSGSADIKLEGASPKSAYAISGRAEVNALGLLSKTCDIQISGMGNAEVNVSDQMKVVISGMGNIRYRGNPKISQVISGMGKISSE